MRTDLLHLHHTLVAAALLPMANAQSLWSRIPTTGTPAARTLSAIAYDVARARLVLFAGETATTAIQMLGDTWEFDGVRWHQAAPANTPVARWGHGMTYDYAHGTVVLFGGCTGNGTGAPVLDDTWSWNGIDWQQLSPPSRPSARTAMAMTWDNLNGRVLLHGGRNNTTQAIVYSGDLWSWNGTTWTLLDATGPTRCAHGIALDLLRGEVVLFGGVNPTTRGDTWTWNGSWTQRVVTGPTARWGHRLLYQPIDNVVLLQGGNTAPTQTWQWNGTAWTQLAAGPSRFNHALEFDSQAGRPVLCGGEATASPALETWSFGTPVPGTFSAFGTGCAGSLGVPALQNVAGSLPTMGSNLQLRVTNVPALAIVGVGFSNATWNGLSLPFDATPLGLTNCTLYSAVDLQYAGSATGNVITLALAVPFEPTLLGLRFYCQAAVVDAAANPAGIALSNAATGTLGRP